VTANPILVELTRGPLVESVHRGALAVADASGRIVFSRGNIETPVYPRSSLKPMQALPLVESGAAEAFDVSEEELALACASHSGEPMHTERVAAWLARIDCSVADLACGPHSIRHEPTAAAMAARGEKPTALHNNCSGKHAGFLTLAKQLGVPTMGYERADHPVQRAVGATLRELAGLKGELPFGIDGCAAPNFAVPISAMARVCALFANPATLAPRRREAIGRIVAAMIAHPDLVAGTGRADTMMMREAKGRAAIKTGAEGYYIAILPHASSNEAVGERESGLGIALSIDDGTSRASEAAIAALLVHFGVVPADGETARLARGPVTNTRGDTVGEHRPSEDLLPSA
jgi:L-asparaginase II